MSLEEERARQAASAPAAATPALEAVPEAFIPSDATPAASAIPATPVAVEKDAAQQAAILAGAQVEDVGMTGDDEDADLAMALALSRGEDDVEMDDLAGMDDEDAEIARASELLSCPLSPQRRIPLADGLSFLSRNEYEGGRGG